MWQYEIMDSADMALLRAIRIVDRANALVCVTVKEHPEALRAESPVGLVIGIFANIVGEDQFVLQASQRVFGIFGDVAVACRAVALGPTAVPEHAIALEAAPPIILVMGIYRLIVR
jgi:hypothetical protein